VGEHVRETQWGEMEMAIHSGRDGARYRGRDGEGDGEGDTVRQTQRELLDSEGDTVGETQ
jgi:hypothetical protein